MDKNDLLTIFYTAGGITSGIAGGILGDKLISQDEKSSWRFLFYVLATLTILLAVALFIFFNPTKMDIPIIVALAFSISSGVALSIITKVFLDKKDVFKSSDLDPIVNSFTSKADKKEIKLFGGDLSFMGNTPSDIDNHPQYGPLRSAQFKKVLILCEEPNDNTKKIRYGKILADIPDAEVRFYNPDKADLRVRGRIIQVNGSPKLLIYIKVKSGIYRAVETDTSNSNGALYSNIWDLVWDLAYKPTSEDIAKYKSLFNNA